MRFLFFVDTKKIFAFIIYYIRSVTSPYKSEGVNSIRGVSTNLNQGVQTIFL
jgi:hypothetical protein